MNHLLGSVLIKLASSLSKCIAVSLLAGAAVSISAQGVGSGRGLPGGDGGIHTIQGRVYAPSGRQVETPLKVRLESNESPSMTAVTDRDGAFQFRNVNAGEYRLTVEGGTQFENETEYPSIYREASTGGRIVTLAIQMRLKEALDPAFASVPNEARAQYNKAMESIRGGDSKKAVEQLKAALAIHPSFLPALNALGVQYLKLGQPDKAAEVLQASLKENADSFSARLNYGIALLNQKKFAEAETELAAAVKKNDKSPTAHMYLGIALVSQKKLPEAESELSLATASNSNEVAMAHRYLGGIYWGKREYGKAADELETYLKLHPKAADADRTKAAIKELRSKK
jgi:tetratricopeptide (TPR) repeat protein